MKLTDDDKMMIISGHAQAIVNIANGGYPIAGSQISDVVERLKRMMVVLADPASEAPKA